jgi:hypothetical protein
MPTQSLANVKKNDSQSQSEARSGRKSSLYIKRGFYTLFLLSFHWYVDFIDFYPLIIHSCNPVVIDDHFPSLEQMRQVCPLRLLHEPEDGRELVNEPLKFLESVPLIDTMSYPRFQLLGWWLTWCRKNRLIASPLNIF